MSKKKNSPQQPLSPKKYLLTRARSLPIYKCLINTDWETGKMASIIVMRRHNNGHITAGFYLVDLLALGVKDTHFEFNKPEPEIQERIPEDIFTEIPYTLAHNIIYGAIAFAEDFDMYPHKDFAITQYILGEDTDDIEFIDIEFGIDGEPGFITKIDNDIDDDENYLPDFSMFTDDDWRDYFTSQKEEDPVDEFEEVTNVLFEKWYTENKRPFTPQADAEEITYDPIDTAVFKSEKEHDTSNEIYHKLMDDASHSPDIHAIEKQLHEMILANPDNPVYYNYLMVCAQHKSDDNQVLEILRDTLKKFPDYLFAKTNHCTMLLQNDQAEEAARVFGDRVSLLEVYPHRRKFHASEILAFHNCLLALALKTEDMPKAKYHYDILCKLDDDYLDSSDFFIGNEIEFDARKIKIVMQYMQEKRYVEMT